MREAHKQSAQTSPTEQFAHFRDDPVGFARKVVGYELSPDQEAMLCSVRDDRFTAVKSGQKTGKTVCDALAALWWVSTRPRGFVLLTSGSETQLRYTLWKEVRKAHTAARKHIGGDCKKLPQAGLQFDDGRLILGVTTNDYDPERFAGYSGDQLLIIIDEASRFPTDLYEAARGNLLGGGRLLATSNPTRTSGWFFEAFRRQEGWALHTLDSTNTPNYIEGSDVIPGLATREGVQALIDEWGERSPVVAVRVRGEFAEHADDAVVGLADIEAAQARWHETQPSGRRLTVGVDVARYGDDDSVISPVRGNYAYPQKRIHGADTDEVAGEVQRIVKGMLGPKEQHTPIVRVDVINMGAGVYDRLKRAPNIQAVAVNVGERPKDPDRYMLKRDEVWFAATKWIRDGGCLPPDDKLSAELLAPRYGVDERGRVRVESKDKIKPRLGRSPDGADALCLAVYGATDSDRSPVEHHTVKPMVTRNWKPI